MINFTHTPPQFSPVYTDGLYFIVSADTNHYKFRYTYHINVDGNLVFEGKATPNPYGLGVIDVSRILKTYVKNNPISYWNNTPIYTHQTFPFSRPSQDETINYEVLVGYEYASSDIAQITGFTGGGVSGDTIGPPTQTAGLYKTFHSTMGVNGRANEQDFNIDPFVLSGTPTGTNPTTSGLFLTNSPRFRKIQPDEYYTLAFTNYYLGGSLLSEPYYVEYKFYDNNGTLLDTKQYENVIGNGGGPLPNCSYVYPSWYLMEPTGNTEYNTLYVGAGAKNLEPIMPADTAQYTIQLFGKFTGTTSPIVPTPTPTPTPSVPPAYQCSGDCSNYSVTNNGLFGSCDFTYWSCSEMRFITIPIPASSSVIVNCVCTGSITYECDLDVSYNSPCTSSPCDLCYEIIATNDDTDPITYYYYDCNIGSWTGRTQPGLTGVVLSCVCNTFNTPRPGMSFTINSTCSAPSPTPTPTPTPAPTCPGYIAWNIVTCSSTCTGVCNCVEPQYDTVYTDCSVIDITAPSTIIYVNSSLSGVFSGYFQKDGFIYQSSTFGVSLECGVGGPC